MIRSDGAVQSCASMQSSPAYKETAMHASKETLTVEKIGDVYEGRFADWGEFTGYFERIKGGTDFTPLFAGLPDNMCQSPHWGYVFKGKLRFTYKDHVEE